MPCFIPPFFWLWFYDQEGNKCAKKGGCFTCIGIAGEVPGPGDEGGVFGRSRGDGVAADGGHDAGVREGGVGFDDGVGYVVVD